MKYFIVFAVVFLWELVRSIIKDESEVSWCLVRMALAVLIFFIVDSLII